MSLTIQCSTCGKTLKVKDELAGKRVKCPTCKAVLIIPSAKAKDLRNDRLEQAKNNQTKSAASPPTLRGRVRTASPVMLYGGAGAIALIVAVVAYLVFFDSDPPSPAVASKTSSPSAKEAADSTPPKPTLPANPMTRPEPNPVAKAQHAADIKRTEEEKIRIEQAAMERKTEEERIRAEKEKADLKEAEMAQRERQRQEELMNPSLERPAHWHVVGNNSGGFLGALLTVGTLPSYEFQKLAKRSIPKSLLEAELKQWSDALNLKAVAGSENEKLKALVTYLGLLDGLYENEAFSQSKSENYRSRIAVFSEEQLNAWQTVLNEISGEPLERIEIMLYVIQIDSMFEGQDATKMNVQKSAELIQRLQSLDPLAIEEWSQVIDSNKGPAALALMQKEGLFNQTSFQKEHFQTMVKAAKEKFPPAKNKVGETPKPKETKPKPLEVDPEKTAAAKLGLAKQLLKTNKSAALKRLQEIVDDFEGTAAAKEAEDLLNKN